jgi:hypothetical protein
MTNPGAPSGADVPSDADLIDAAQAAHLLEVGPAQVEAMVEEGLLTPVGSGAERRFRRDEVLAVRQLGG